MKIIYRSFSYEHRLSTFFSLYINLQLCFFKGLSSFPPLYTYIQLCNLKDYFHFCLYPRLSHNHRWHCYTQFHKIGHFLPDFSNDIFYFTNFKFQLKCLYKYKLHYFLNVITFPWVQIYKLAPYNSSFHYTWLDKTEEIR